MPLLLRGQCVAEKAGQSLSTLKDLRSFNCSCALTWVRNGHRLQDSVEGHFWSVGQFLLHQISGSRWKALSAIHLSEHKPPRRSVCTWAGRYFPTCLQRAERSSSRTWSCPTGLVARKDDINMWLHSGSGLKEAFHFLINNLFQFL